MDFQAGVDRIALTDPTIDVSALIRSATVVNGSTVLALGAGQTIIVLNQTGIGAAWFGG